MHRKLVLLCCCALLGITVGSAPLAQSAPEAITTATLLEEMADLERLARWPSPGYRTVQFSSYDRRSTTSEAPGWFSNADGFGREPIPGFEKVLRPPEGGGTGLYLVAQVAGPGAIVRGWSAGMGGILRVYLDPPTESGAGDGGLVWEGPAYDFLARRSGTYLKQAGLALEAQDAFTQNDADYLPMPFSRGLKVTWEGKLNELHFYHLQVRLYPQGTPVRMFDPAKDLKAAESQIRKTITALTKRRPAETDSLKLEGDVEPGRSWTWSPPTKGPGAINELRLRLQAGNLNEALRGCLLRIAFDDAQRAQVEAPVGDFFASGPGVNPFASLPLAVEPDGTMSCRFVMPYEKKARLELVNHTKAAVRVDGSIKLTSWQWDERSLYFRAKWRVDHDLLAGAGEIDLPYLVAIGKGVFVGCAAMIMNPSGVPTAGGNWWGEGDEKILVDGEVSPSTFGTGSEDYFNYSWSRADLFAHPYCGQPLDSGPDTSGYVSNHRFQVMDALPFETSLALYLELWAHNRTPGMSYARISYHYARPGMVDDHRALMPSDLRIPPLSKREPKALGGAAKAQFHFFDALGCEASSGTLETVPFELATQLRIVRWRAEKGGRLKFNLPVESTGRASLHIIAVHEPNGATVRVLLDGKPLSAAGGAEEIKLHAEHTARVLNVNFKPLDMSVGTREVILECTAPGVVGLDCLWLKPE